MTALDVLVLVGCFTCSFFVVRAVRQDWREVHPRPMNYVPMRPVQKFIWSGLVLIGIMVVFMLIGLLCD